MSRHSRAAEATAPRRFRRRGQEPSIMEWLDSGSYGPYAADSNRGAVDEPASPELPPPLPPPGSEGYDTGTFDASPYRGASAEVSPSHNGSYASYNGSYGAASVDQSSSTGSYGTASYGAAVESPASSAGPYGTSTDESSFSGSYGAPFSRAGSAEESSSYGTAVESPASSYGGSSYGAAVESPAASGGSYGASFSRAVPVEESSYGTPSYGTAAETTSYGTAAGSPAYSSGSYGVTSYGSASTDGSPSNGASSYGATSYSGSYGGSSYGSPAETSSNGKHESPDGSASASLLPPSVMGLPGEYSGSYDPARYRSDGESTVDTYGTHASRTAPAVSTPDSPAGESFLAPPAYERPGERYRSIPAVADPSRPAPGEYGLVPAEPPMADYLTRAPFPDPPVVDLPAPVRRPTTPIPSAARSRKAPKEPPPPPVNRAGRLRMRVNPVACDGHGICAELLPEVITQDDWGYPMPVVAEIPAELEVHAQRAAQQCPTLAIILERRQPRST